MLGANGVAVDGAGNIYVTGFETSDDEGSNIWIRKLDPGGNEIWTRTYNGSAGIEDEGRAVAVDGEGNVYVAGFETPENEEPDIWARKYSPDGTPLWTETHDGPVGYIDGANAVTLDPDGNLLVTGYETVGGEGFNIWTRKYRLFD